MKPRLFVAACVLSACGLFAIAAVPQPAESPKAATPVAAGAWNVDSGHSSIIFRVRHAGVSNFYGRFNKVDGSYTFDPAAFDAAKFDVTIDAESVDSNSGGRDKHLKGPDFFNTAQHPKITFISKGVTKNGEAFELSGDLTMLGVTKPVKAKLEWGGQVSGERGQRSGLEAIFTIKRSDFGMNYGVENGGVGDDVTLFVSLEGTRK